MFSKNRAFWDAESVTYQRDHGATLWANPLAWGVWRIPESEVGALGDLRGRRVLELGCGAAQWTCALRQQGIGVTGLDLSSAQLAAARAHAAALAVTPPLVQAGAEQLPFRDSAFDVIFCDHGAMTFAPPEHAVARSVAGAARRRPVCVLHVNATARRLLPPADRRVHGHARQRLLFPGTARRWDERYGATAVRRMDPAVSTPFTHRRGPDRATGSTRRPYDVSRLRFCANGRARWPAEHIWKTRRERRTEP